MSTTGGALGDRATLEWRGDLARVIDRLGQGPGAIAYFGASITAQREGYRPRLAAALREATGHEHRSINAGIGGVGSISGLFLMDRLVLAHEPDLCLVEFSAADRLGWTPRELIAPTLEAIVWRLRSQGCEPCFVHLYRADGANVGVLDIYDRIARHHSVSAIDISAYFTRAFAARRWAVEDLLRDVVHTTPLGSEVVAETLLEELIRPPRQGVSDDHTQARLLYEGRFHGAHVEPARVEQLRGSGPHLRERFRLTYEYVVISADTRFECRFDGELLGLVLIVGPESGMIRVSGEGRSIEFSTWDPSCYYERLSTAVFDHPWPPGASVTIRPTDAPVDYSGAVRPVLPPDAPKRLKLIGFMVGS